MSDDRPAADVASRPDDDRASAAALTAHRARQRPWRIAYAAAIVVVALALVVVVKIAYSHGEISHATLHAVPKAAPSVSLQTPAATVHRSWTSTDATAIGDPVWNGTVITSDKHTVRGRNALTGAVTWSYTRTDRTVCTAIQDGGVTIAVYRLNGNCDQLTAVDSGTGTRRWTRTLDEDNAHFNGPAHYVVVPGTVMFVSAKAIYAIDPDGDEDTNGGVDHWLFREQGCTITNAVLGTAGALISQTCVHRKCGADKFCGNGQQLVLRDPMSGENTNDTTNHNNPDQIKWNLIGSDLVPATADQVVSAVEPDGSQLAVLASKTGKIQSRIPLTGSPAASSVTSVTTADAELLHLGTTTYALEPGASSFRWKAGTTAVPTVSSSTGTGLPSLAKARLTAPTPAGVASLDPDTGTVTRTYPVPAPRGSRIVPLGTGFVLAAGTSTVAYE